MLTAPPITQPWYRRLHPGVWLALLVALLAGALLALLILLAVGLFFYYQVSGKIVPGVDLAGVSLSGLTREQAAVRIHAAWNLEKSIRVEDGLTEQTLSPASLGISVDDYHTADQAYSYGHDPFLLEAFEQFYACLMNPCSFIPEVEFDEAAARQELEALSGQFSLSAQDAGLQYSGGQVASIPAKLGYTPNIDATIAAIAADPMSVLNSGVLHLQLMPVPPLIQDASALITEANTFIAQPLTIRGYDALANEWITWQVDPQMLASWLAVEPGDHGPRLTLREDLVAAYLAQTSDSLAPGRKLDTAQATAQVLAAVRQGTSPWVVISHNPSVYTVSKGDTLLKISWKIGMPVWTLIQSNPGIDINKLSTGQQLNVPSRDEMLPLPIVPNKRIVLSISKQRMWVYQDGKLLNKFVISTGIDRSPTQPGVFQVQTHDPNAYASVWDLTMPNFLGIYEAWPGFMNGIHGLPMLSNGRRLWGSILGHPASFGCIILTLDAAKWLYDWAENGVVVEIQT